MSKPDYAGIGEMAAQDQHEGNLCCPCRDPKRSLLERVLLYEAGCRCRCHRPKKTKARKGEE